MKRFSPWVLLLGSLLSFKLQALPLRHQIRPLDSPISLQTQGLCHSFYRTKEGMRCLPFSSGVVDKGSISIQALVKANERGLRILKRVQDKDLNSEFVDQLFREDSFHDASGFAEARAQYANFGLSLIPLFEMGAYKLNNPGLPEIHYMEIRQSQLTMSSTWMLPAGQLLDWLLAVNVYGFERTEVRGDYDALEAATTPTRDLAKTSAQKGMDLDLSLGWISKTSFLPSLLLRGTQLLNPSRCGECAVTYFELESYFLTRSSTSLVWTIRHPIGESIGGINVPFEGLYRKEDQDRAAVSYTYKLSNLSSFLAYSMTQSSFGFALDANFYKVGIQYTNEKQPFNILARRVNQTYVYAALDL